MMKPEKRKEYMKEYMKKYKKNNKKYKEYKKNYKKEYKDSHKQEISAYNKKYREQNKEKIKAHRDLNKAIKDGKVIRPNYCEYCGNKCKPDAHHYNYNRPLDVLFMCDPCHQSFHKDLRFVIEFIN